MDLSARIIHSHRGGCLFPIQAQARPEAEKRVDPASRAARLSAGPCPPWTDQWRAALSSPPNTPPPDPPPGPQTTPPPAKALLLALHLFCPEVSRSCLHMLSSKGLTVNVLQFQVTLKLLIMFFTVAIWWKHGIEWQCMPTCDMAFWILC